MINKNVDDNKRYNTICLNQKFTKKIGSQIKVSKTNSAAAARSSNITLTTRNIKSYSMSARSACIYRIDENGFLANVEPRQFIVAGASPEAFRFGDIYAIYHDSSDEELSTMTSAGAIALAHSIPMKAIDAGVLNLKITYHNDMELFLALADNYFFPDDMEKENN
jgi:2-C-methyl-D-erythritol 4-phosphate cytidylyltransferase